MAIILHIETSAALCSVSIAENGETLSAINGNVINDHIAQLTTLIDKVVKQATLTLKQLHAIAVSSGPGSYTGLRIGVSTAKGICHALQLPLIAVNSLESMVNGARDVYPQQDVLFCPLIDARRMEVYTLVSDYSGEIIIPQQAAIINEDHFLKEILQHNKIVLFGSGLTKCKSFFNNENCLFIEDYIQTSTSMHLLANRQFNSGNFADVAYFEPTYIKEFYTTLKIK